MSASATSIPIVRDAGEPTGRLRRLALAGLLAALLGALIGVAVTSPAHAATRCPATFTVLHNDRVGSMAVPAGAYNVSVTAVRCTTSSSLIARFLADFDGVLPGGWAPAASGVGFVNGSTGASIAMSRAARPSGGGGGGGGGACPGTFTVEHNDRVGALSLPAGQYVVRTRGLSCAAAANQFAFFLFHDEAGSLPRGWSLNVAARRFSRGGSSFTVTRTSGKTSGGGQHPSHAITCQSTVTLAAGTSVGSLVLPAGRYYVNVFSSFSCSQATAAFKQFAAARALPAEWTLEPETATFLRGRQGFQVEPVS